MKKLMNTLYVTSANRYLSLDGENVVILEEQKEIGRVPLHNLEGIVTFGYTGVSPRLMGTCAQKNISLTFMTEHGRFLARVCGEVRGNVTLRRQQYRIADNTEKRIEVARNCIVGKVYNSRWILERAIRDYPLRLDVEKIKEKSSFLASRLKEIRTCESPDKLLGLEGESASVYFSVFDELILQQKETFYFHGRNRRPPLDNVNAMLSFAYSLLAGICCLLYTSDAADSFRKKMVLSLWTMMRERNFSLHGRIRRRKSLHILSWVKRWSGGWYRMFRQCFWPDIFVEIWKSIRHSYGSR